jgi:hypothetical protein
MLDGGRQHHPERLARNQLVASIVGLLLAPVEKLADRH